jgi:hypothetical protein
LSLETVPTESACAAFWALNISSQAWNKTRARGRCGRTPEKRAIEKSAVPAPVTDGICVGKTNALPSPAPNARVFAWAFALRVSAIRLPFFIRIQALNLRIDHA